MKVFATLATLLGASTATTQHFHQNQLHGSNNMRMDQHSMNSLMKPSMGIDGQMSRGMSDMGHQMSDMRNMYRNNQDMTSDMMHRNMMGQQMDSNMMGHEMGRNMMGQEMGHNMMGQEVRSNMYSNNQGMSSNMMHRNMMGKEMGQNMMGQEMGQNMRLNMHQQDQAFGPNQFFVKDDSGNYVYSYNNQMSEKSEKNNGRVTKGQYAYIMSNGVKRRVEYIADDNGFHIIRDNADPARIKRSSEPDFVQTRMTSVMDSSSLRDDANDRYRMSNAVMGRDMTSQMDGNRMGMDQQRYSNAMMGRNMMGRDSMDLRMMGQDSMGHRTMGQDNMGSRMMGRNIYNIMSNRGMASGMSDLMGQQMNVNAMGRDMTLDVMDRNMMVQDRSSQIMGRNMEGHRDMTPNMMYSNVMGQDMRDVTDRRNQMTSNTFNTNNGQRMMQQMERVPETYTSTRFF